MRYLAIPGGNFRIFVDGKPTAVAAIATPTDYSFRCHKIDFGTVASRNIEIEFGSWIPFGGINIPPNYDIWPVAVDPLRFLAQSDSYWDNGGTANSYVQCAGPTLGRLLGVQDFWLDAVGGRGYLGGASFDGGSAYTPRVKLPDDITPYAPDWIAIALGINDVGKDPSTLQAEVVAYMAALMTANPYAAVTIIGPWRAPGLNPAQNIADAIKAAVQAHPEYAGKRIQYFDTFAENWQQIAGRVGATSGTGNSNVYIGADNVHPNQIGHDYIAWRSRAAILSHAALLAA